jgi:hypothetical protein
MIEELGDTLQHLVGSAAQDYRREYVTARIRASSDKPLDAQSRLEHESADRFGTALHAPVREIYGGAAWQQVRR